MRIIADRSTFIALAVCVCVTAKCPADEVDVTQSAPVFELPAQPGAPNDAIELVSHPAELNLTGTNCGEACCDSSQPCGALCCPNPWYVSVSGAWQQRETVHEVEDSRTFIEFDSGFLANAAIGARINAFRLEFETSFMNNEVDLAGAAGLSSPSPGNVNLRAYMFNAYYDIQFRNTCWKPYVGAGIGTYQSEINGLIPEFFGTIGPPFNSTPVNATSDMPFAYQFRAGVTRPLGCHTELFTGYRYFHGNELEFAAAPFAAPGATTFHPDGAKVHAIELGVRVNF